MDTKRLGGKRNLTNRLDSSRSGSERRRSSQQLGPLADGNGDLKTGEQDADDHGAQ
jgi:hypothetical protein